MLRGLAIENFKPFGPMQHIPMAPITLLYGANSTGKSSTIQSLALLRSALANDSLDPLAPQLGFGEREVQFDLGSYRSVVFRQEVSRTITITATVDTSSVPEVDAVLRSISRRRIREIEVAVSIAHPPSSAPTVAAIQVHANGKTLIAVSRTDCNSYVIDEARPSFLLSTPESGSTDTLSRIPSDPRGVHIRIHRSASGMDSEPYWDTDSDATVDLIAQPCHSNADSPSQDDDTPATPGIRVGPPSQLLSALQTWLDSVVYLGSDRKPNSDDIRAGQGAFEIGRLNWAWSGIAFDNELRALANSWLRDPLLLNTPYELRLVDAPPDIGCEYYDVVFYDTRYHMELSHEQVGGGLSQVIPVLATLRGDNRTYIIDQPELHLHPKLQTALGDVLIRSLRERGNRYLLETHSEHLLLRLMRRIRETAEEAIPPDSPFALHPEDVSIVVLQAGDDGVCAHSLGITEEGEFTKSWPGGFFHERREELM